mgnify:CR=1 FL=1
MGIFIGLIVIGLIIGVVLVVPMLIMSVGGFIWAQKYARNAIDTGKIEDKKKTEAVLKMLRASNDSESKLLYDELSNLLTKTIKME